MLQGLAWERQADSEGKGTQSKNTLKNWCMCIPQMTGCFLRRDNKGINSEGMGGEEELREIGEWETITRKYCMKKNYFKKTKDKGKMRFFRKEKKRSWNKDESHLEDSVADFFPESIQGPKSFMFLVRILQDLAPCSWVLTPLTEVGSL